MTATMNTPVLLIVFNRPHLTQRALQAICAAQPKTLLVAADGARSEDEKALCEATREVITQSNFEGQLETNYADNNMGCGVRVRTAIDWALSKYESVIVLEDDCIANPSFFSYCEVLLDRYRDDERVMHISGNNFQAAQTKFPHSYYFSKYSHAWGWATWRRAWQLNDWNLSQWPELRTQNWLEKHCEEPLEREYWQQIFDSSQTRSHDIWDYQWMFSCWLHNGLIVIPAVNLVSNIGTGDDATHTRECGRFFNLPSAELGEITHPAEVQRNVLADRYIFNNNFGGDESRRQRSLRARLRRRFPWLATPLRLVRALIGATKTNG